MTDPQLIAHLRRWATERWGPLAATDFPYGIGLRTALRELREELERVEAGMEGLPGGPTP